MATIAEVNNLKSRLDSAQAAVLAAEKQERDLDALAREYNRQSVEHAAAGRFQDSQIAAARRNSTVLEWNASKETLSKLKTDLARANSAYQDAVNNLNPEEKTVYIKQEQAKNAAASTQNTVAFIQGTTKYLIWGAVALVIIVGAIIIFRKKYSA